MGMYVCILTLSPQGEPYMYTRMNGTERIIIHNLQWVTSIHSIKCGKIFRGLIALLNG